jgi:hypothetical protein
MARKFQRTWVFTGSILPSLIILAKKAGLCMKESISAARTPKIFQHTSAGSLKVQNLLNSACSFEIWREFESREMGRKFQRTLTWVFTGETLLYR